ncbi:Curculin domain protein (mannose-binding) lectin [Catenulispora acidiphila DSM 44928]|uniref:Curculin domain protein (Mannose-binding) lectin n=1 Tax=Catenulispora acidiphila (strain DSM 44928 / JCM 14897 / NBRC 102108 / NRRL B-24433 / ID139908) TaxID=479433 RepID=C7QFM6_CATAD|nr:Curculin domain-containing protein (mannose-binding) lectin [Catenulispora acidiphila]ACU68965.1 Curculin domain protein (mannose-binding) lectin [Catenulispora acidiphila DSM 44928]
MVKRTIGAIAGAAALAAALSVAGTGTALAATGGDHLNKGDTMYANDDIHNPAGTKLVFQPDGNLVEYRYDGHVCWATGTNGRGGTRVTYQNDGNLVMYASTDDSRPIWASGTSGDNGLNVNINARGEIWVGYDQLTNACE